MIYFFIHKHLFYLLPLVVYISFLKLDNSSSWSVWGKLTYHLASTDWQPRRLLDFTTKTLILWPLPAVLAFEIESAASVGPLTRLTHTHTQGNPKDSTVRQSRKCATRAKAEGSESWRAMAKVAKATNEWPGALVLKRSWICVVVVLRCRRLSFSFSLSCCRCRCRCRTGGIASHRIASHRVAAVLTVRIRKLANEAIGLEIKKQAPPNLVKSIYLNRLSQLLNAEYTTTK